MRSFKAYTYWLMALMCSCNYSDKKKIQTTREITGATSWGTPIQLLNSLLSSPESGPDQIVAAFESDSRFDGWKRNFPEQMMECAAKFTLVSGRELTVDVFTHWVQKSYEQAASYIQNMLFPDLKDYMIIGMINGLKSENLSVAVAWAHEISNQSLRHELLESLATH